MWSSFMSDDWKPKFENWQNRFPDLVWWLDYNTRKVPRGTVKFKMREVLDNTTEQAWHMRVDGRGKPVAPIVTTSWDDHSLGLAETELKYDVWQYSLIAWCLQKIAFEGWKIRECYDVIKHFWRHLPGQPPLTSNTVSIWWAYHCKFKKEGLLWP